MRTRLRSNLAILLGIVFLFTALFSSGSGMRLATADIPLEDTQPGEFLPQELDPRSAAETQSLPTAGTVIPAAAPAVEAQDFYTQAIPVTPEPGPAEIPIRLVIPAISLDAPIVPAKTQTIKVAGGQETQQWQALNQFAAGWHTSSALPGQPGNTVLNGHHNVYGKVFGRLVDLKVGDLIVVYGAEKTYEYSITNKMILLEKYQQLDVRMDNARWILPSADERLTLITCWPATSNTHRLIIVAEPLGLGGG